MKIFRLKHSYTYTELIIFGIKISHKQKMLNKFISLGNNCLPRRKLTEYGIKPLKKQGELSCPFDLCVTPIESVKQILENDFSDYFDNLQFDEEKKCWKNTKYNITFLHDNLSKEDFVKRYKQRIKNFRQITANRKNIVFVQFLFHEENDESIKQDIVKINNSLNHYCRHKYTYKIINLIPNIPANQEQIQLLANNVYYIKYLSPYGTDWPRWWHPDINNKPEVQFFMNKCIKQIYKG